MATIREILIEWNTPSGTGKRSVLYFDTAGGVAAQRTTIKTWLDAIKSQLVISCQFGVATSGREIDDTTGTLVGSWVESSAKSGNGAVATTSVADATQVICRWKTSTIVNGRFLQGRTFVPGLAAANLSGGNLSAGALAVFNPANAAMVAGATGFRIWHRPKKDPITHVILAPGSSAATTGSDTWAELGVLRRRRS